MSVEQRSVFVVGLDGAGKSALTNKIRILHHETALVPLQPTMGQNLSRFRRKNLQLEFWDLGGQKRIRKMWSSYLPKSDVLLYVVDAAAPDRFDESIAELKALLEQPSADGVPLLAVLNKCDLPEADPEAFRKRFYELGALLEGRRHGVELAVCDFDPASAARENTELDLTELREYKGDPVDWEGINCDRIVEWLDSAARERPSRKQLAASAS